MPLISTIIIWIFMRSTIYIQWIVHLPIIEFMLLSRFSSSSRYLKSNTISLLICNEENNIYQISSYRHTVYNVSNDTPQTLQLPLVYILCKHYFKLECSYVCVCVCVHWKVQSKLVSLPPTYTMVVIL